MNYHTIHIQIVGLDISPTNRLISSTYSSVNQIEERRDEVLLDEILELVWFIGASVIATPSVPNSKLVESQHINDWNLSDSHAK